jgi:integrase
VSIKKVEYSRRKGHLRYDGDRKVWLGYQVDVTSRGKRYRDTFPTRAEAERFIAAVKTRGSYAKAGLRSPAAQHIRISHLFAARLRQISNRKEQVRATRVFDTFRETIGEDARVDAIRSSHFQRFINRRTADGVAASSIDREINIISSAFGRAAELFPEALEDFEPPKAARPRYKQRRRERIITVAENDRIVADLRRPRDDDETPKVYENRLRIARMWEIAWYLGLRYGEIEKLRKTDYDGERLHVTRYKTQTVTVFDHLPAEVHALIREAIEGSSSDHIFSLNGSPPKDFYKILRDAATRAGLRWGSGHRDGITFHSLRHSFVTRLIQVTDLATAKSFSGHSDSEMVAIYSHASDESRRQAMTALYGSKEIGRERLRELFDQVRKNEIDFDEFERRIRP